MKKKRPIWRDIQARSFSRFDDLYDFLELSAENRRRLIERPRFPLLVPYRLALRIPKNNVDHPMARQFLPLKEEGRHALSFVDDPTCDKDFKQCDKLLHKYEGRALLLSTSACAMHCRYCFRQNFPYETQGSDFQRELQYIRENDSLHEVILSGGDPLSLSDYKLKSLLDSLEEIPHLQFIRFHTRFPVGIPERITEELLANLKALTKRVIFVFHINHPDELGEDLFKFIRPLQENRITTLCQTVLLKGVNDDVETLKELSLLSSRNGILPYYLHQLDRVQGAMHFEVPKERGLQLINALRAEIPGHALFRYVQEIPHKPSKTPLGD